MSAPTTRERIAAYLRAAGLESLVGREEGVERAIRDLLEAMEEKVAILDPSSLYSYLVPMFTADGTCSIVDELAPVPYDLAAILGGRSDQPTRRPSLRSGPGQRVQAPTRSLPADSYERRPDAAGQHSL